MVTMLDLFLKYLLSSVKTMTATVEEKYPILTDQKEESQQEVGVLVEKVNHQMGKESFGFGQPVPNLRLLL